MTLQQTANHARLTCFQALVKAGGGHFGGSLSEMDILTTLYFDEMNIDPENPRMHERDRFILSKGHGGPGVYTTLALRGYFPVERLSEIDKNGSDMPKHVNRLKLAGVDVSSGSLGQGLSVGNGMALAAKIDGTSQRVYVLMGDGELDEGQVWEAAMTSAKNKLDNIVAIIDRNRYQVDGSNEEIMPLQSVEEKFKAFGWNTISCNGHSTDELQAAFKKARETKGVPSVIVADTIKGKGVSFMENTHLWHSGSVNAEQAEQGKRELEEAMA